MSIMELGALGEFFSSVAVLATLIYLAKQVRDNSKLIDTSVYESFMNSYTEMNQAIVSNPDVARFAALTISESDEQLSNLDALRLNQHIRWYCNIILKMFRLYERRVLPEQDWDSAAREAHQILSSTRVGLAFIENNHFFDELWEELERRAGDRPQQITDFGMS